MSEFSPLCDQKRTWRRSEILDFRIADPVQIGACKVGCVAGDVAISDRNSPRGSSRLDAAAAPAAPGREVFAFFSAGFLLRSRFSIARVPPRVAPR